MSGSTTGKVFGKPVDRLEDRPLVMGKGKYLDDLKLGNDLAVAFVRSPYAHAGFTQIDVTAAKEMPGVVAVYTIEDFKPYLTATELAVGLPSAAIALVADRPILAVDEVVYVGEAIAMVVAETRSQAEDAADAVEIDFEPLPVVADCRQAMEPDADTVHRKFSHNCLAKFGFDYGDVDEAFAGAAHVVKGSYEIHRGGAHSLEGRGALAYDDTARGVMQIWSSTQTPHALKRVLSELLGREEDRVSVTVPDVGGGFGPKLVTYPEEIAVAVAAIILRRPVKWVEDRREHFLSTTQERDQFWDMEMALDGNGAILGLRGRLLHDHGAYTARGVNVPYGSGLTMPLPYNIPAYKLDVAVVLTNKTPVTPVRGAGQPQAAFVMERLMDKAAAHLGIGRVELRSRNLVRAEQMPCAKPLKLRGGTQVVLDSGDYPSCQRDALSQSRWDEFEARREAARNEGRFLGIGLANYVEATGRGPYETVSVRISRTGKIIVKTGAAAMGQGTMTMIAQIVGEQLGGDLDNIIVKTGDSEEPLGFGGFNSRQTVIAGASAHQAALDVREKILKVASHILSVDASELDISGNRVVPVGGTNRDIGFAELAASAAGLPGFQLPGITEPGLFATSQVVIDDMAFSNGSAVAEVEVDLDTGQVKVLDFTLAHDCGRIINPKTVDGQIIGGIAHGLGNSLFERMLFDAEAQPLSSTFADYLMVTAAEMPNIAISHRESPSPLNALGVKGVGESGVIPVTPAVAAAIDDALSHLGVHIDQSPISPQALYAKIAAAHS